MLKLRWMILSSSEDWVVVLRTRFLQNNHLQYVKYAIWSSTRHFMHILCDNSSSIIGSCLKIHFWNDKCLNDKIFARLNLPSQVDSSL